MDHSEEEEKFGLEVTGVFKDALSLQANESVQIFHQDSLVILNSKSEFYHPTTARVMVKKKKKLARAMKGSAIARLKLC